ncbi:MAG: hypothetical protein D6693_02300 [Planctomycetota bacterium]|nr:MAG: hypothetical protein D6693_02300 [Planctomycetota bacterium]
MTRSAARAARVAAPAAIVAGVDEAGYGPRIGPLAVGLSVFRVESAGANAGAAAVDLWSRLRRVVGRAGDSRAVVQVDDSKRLKGAAGSRHPMGRIERGVLAFLSAAGEDPRDDLAVMRALGAEADLAPWYDGPAVPAPLSTTSEHLSVLAAALRSGLTRGGVAVEEMRCETVGEAAFNERVAETGSKAAVNFAAAGRCMRRVWRLYGEQAPTAVVDRQGGRVCYGGALARVFPDARVRALDEQHERSEYEIEGRAGAQRRMRVVFEIGADGRHLPVALASMTAKYVRELAMARLNRYWSRRVPGLAPTAGYGVDARRWLREVNPLLTVTDRRRLVRRA